MTRQEFLKKLNEGSIPSVLFFEGPEEHMKQEALALLRKALLPEGFEDLNESRLTDPETDALIAASETLPFMADRRLVLVRDHPAIVGRGEADDRLISYLPQVPSTTVLVFYCVLPVKQKKIRNAVQKLGGIVQFSPMSDTELTTFVTRAFHDLGRECDARTADFLIFTCGSDANLLLNEIAKIASFHPDNPAVSPDDIRALATASTESSVFDLVNAVVSGDGSAAFRKLNHLLMNGEQRTMILSMLLRQFRLMQHVKIMQYEKRSSAEIASLLGMKPFAVQQYTRQAALYNGRQVKEAVALCLDTDLAVKSGELRDEGALETVMLKLLQLRAGQ